MNVLVDEVSRRDAVIAQAVWNGKIGPARVDAWAQMWDLDPQAVEATLSAMAPGVIPVARELPTPVCHYCGGSGWIEVRALIEVYGRKICDQCGRQPFYRRWEGAPVHSIDSGWRPGLAREVTDSDAVLPPPPTVTVWCGPPAPYPTLPTPEDILRAAGIDPDTVFL